MRRLVLWGQQLAEYKDMFGLSEIDLNKRFLEYNCGASSFNSDLHKRSNRCISCDPWYALSKSEIEKKIDETFAKRLSELCQHLDNIDVSRYGSIDKLVAARRNGIDDFLADYELGLQDGRYLAIATQELPFENFEFDFALVANNFFGNSDLHAAEYYLTIIKELARVAKEVRIFPLVDANGNPSSLLGPILLDLNQANFGVEVKDVSYHLQPRGNAMLRVAAKQCEVVSG
ncbi:MAG: hypothetical protein A3E88_06545 [Legionellales bacterium RIFCSPHIGHO2_12_FULL_35_11]|nr:MAG: hypothetical protein A3E88_06545 [Legionellales bacterium RIFCSPHIGHO2_12_FULL_35_11]